ncbi:MAG: lasso peptide biosynthesis B2 protein [Pyrinomonadaceae bacterium]
MSTRFLVSPQVCSATDKDGTTILDVNAGKLFSAIGFTGRLWSAISAQREGLTLRELHANIFSDTAYGNEEHTKEDLEKVLNQLIAIGLIESASARRKIDAVPYWSLLGQSSALATTRLLLNLDLPSTAAFFQLALFDFLIRFGGFRALHKTVKEWPIADCHLWPQRPQILNESLNTASRWYLKHALCLQRSAALTCLLRTCGMPAEMVVACRRIPFKGHAWVELNGEVVNDKPKAQAVYSTVLNRC